MAIAALVLGILSFFTFGLTAIPALIFGIISLVIIEKSGGRITGRGFAITGIVAPVLGVLPLMGILFPALSRAKEQGKRAVCLNNLKQLSLAWIMYADENDDLLVNGAIGYSNMNMSWGDHTNEVAWVDGLNTGWDNIEEQEEAIKAGALWPYVKGLNMYKCPTGRKEEALTYAIMFSMNAVNHPPTQGVRGAHIKRRSEITNPSPAYRLVFIDEGWMTPDAFAVHYDQEQWWDDPPVRHGDGTTISFADGHSDHWKWKGIDTIKRAKLVERSRQGNWTPETDAGYRDLYMMQKGCWGRLGYTPTYP
jgi:prepilin-type processing-associated H-X9-DG protein